MGVSCEHGKEPSGSINEKFCKGLCFMELPVFFS